MEPIGKLSIGRPEPNTRVSAEASTASGKMDPNESHSTASTSMGDNAAFAKASVRRRTSDMPLGALKAATVPVLTANQELMEHLWCASDMASLVLLCARTTAPQPSLQI
jgi:hypothetical protein